MIKSIAKTKKGNYNVRFEFIPNQVTINTVNAFIDIEGTEYIIKNVNLNFLDKIDVTPEICKAFGIEYNSRIALRCDLTKVSIESKRLRRIEETKKYNGEIIDSDLGFMMKNTKDNAIICAKYGYDAIEMV